MMPSSSKSTNLTPTVALLASPSRIDEMISWVTRNAVSLSGCALVASPKELKEKLQVAQQLALDARMLSIKVETLGDDDNVADALVAQKVLAGQVRGVVWFQDYTLSVPNLSFLIRICDSANVPLALNEATADLCLRGVAKTRIVYLIFNPVAGQGDGTEDLDKIKSILEPTVVLHVIITEKDRNISDQCKEIIDIIQSSEENADDDSSPSFLIVASGGDGTVSEVAGCTMDTGIPFAAIPRGTCNAFSTALGIPTNVEEACNNILFGHIRVIDGGMCNDIPFINLAGVGFEAGLVDNATRELKNVFGNLAYTIGGVQQTLKQRSPFKCAITIDDHPTQTIETDVITVANVAPNSSIFAQGFGEVIPDDGLFEITISQGSNPLESLEGLASLWISSVVKAPSKSDKILRVRAKTLTVDCDPSNEHPPKLLLDGEVLQVNPVTFRIVPNGLHVITPMPDDDESEQ